MTRQRNIYTILCLFIYLLQGPSLRAQSLVVNIDNPSFRKVVAAIPVFFGDDDSTIAKSLKDEGHLVLADLLNFSGVFNLIASQAYQDYVGKMVAKRQSEEGKSWLQAMSKLKGDEQVQWRSLGVESLTLAAMEGSGDSLSITFKTFDVSTNKQILAKKFESIPSVTLVMRRYADFLLTTYTGKPGIFFSRLAFVGRRQKGDNKQIFISDYDGSNLKQITRGDQPFLSPAWGPQGRYLAYTSFEKGNPQIFVYDTEKDTTRQLTQTTGLNSGANWSPDGKFIAYTASNDGDTDIYYLPSGGGKRTLLIHGSGLDVDPKFSPNGRSIAFVSGRYGNPHIFVGRLDDDKDKPKVVRDHRLTYAGWYNSTPAWSPESDKIIFGGYDRDIDRYDIFIMNPDGSQLERLTLKTGDNESPSWSPNSQMIVFQSNRVGQSNTKGVPALFMMNRDGSGQRKLKIPLYEVQTPHWSVSLSQE